jgi:FAD:protein FMN transferase
MATRFEMVLHGHNPVALQAAADEAFLEIERLNAQLSLYLPTSDISYINARAAYQPVRVEPRLFQLLQLAQRLHHETGGAFDLTIAPLIRCWGFMDGSGALPSPQEVAAARERVGFQHVILDEKTSAISFAREGMMLDLGAIGKGYALEQAAEILIDAGVNSALLHGGTSTICAIGAPPDSDTWKVALDYPSSRKREKVDHAPQAAPRPVAIVSLRDESMSVSAVHGKFFEADGKMFGHVIDPRTAYPADGALLAAVVLRSAAETDALSTALLVLGTAGRESVERLRPGLRTLIIERNSDGREISEARGI